MTDVPDKRPLAIVTALRDELMPTVDKLQLRRDGDRYTGEAAGQPIIAGFTGIGAEGIGKAMDEWIIEAQPQCLIIIGLAGGLDPAMEAGQVCWINRVLNEAGEALDIELPVGIGGSDATASQISDTDEAAAEGPGVASLISLDRIAESVDEKAALLEQHGARCVDMETFAAAKRAREAGLTLHVMRAISDPADVALPKVTLNWVREDGTVDTGAAMVYLATHPWQAPKLMNLQRHARAAAQALANEMQRWLSGTDQG